MDERLYEPLYRVAQPHFWSSLGLLVYPIAISCPLDCHYSFRNWSKKQVYSIRKLDFTLRKEKERWLEGSKECLCFLLPVANGKNMPWGYIGPNQIYLMFLVSFSLFLWEGIMSYKAPFHRLVNIWKSPKKSKKIFTWKKTAMAAMIRLSFIAVLRLSKSSEL